MISRCGDKLGIVAKQVLVFDGDSFGEGDCRMELDQSHSPRFGSSARLPKFVGERGQEGREPPHSTHIERWVELCAAAKGEDSKPERWKRRRAQPSRTCRFQDSRDASHRRFSGQATTTAAVRCTCHGNQVPNFDEGSWCGVGSSRRVFLAPVLPRIVPEIFPQSFRRSCTAQITQQRNSH